MSCVEGYALTPREESTTDPEDRFRSIFESSPDPVWIIDNYRFVECNQAAVDCLGYPDKQALRDTHPSTLSPECQPDGESSFTKAQRMINQALQHGLSHFEWVHLRQDGSAFTAEVTLRPIRLDHRQVLYCTWRDITDRKWQENRIRELLDEQQLIFENAQVGIVLLRNRQIVKCNQTLADMLGLSSPCDLEGKTTEVLYSSRDHWLWIGQTGYGQLESQGYASLEAQLQRVDGRKIWAQLTGRSLDRHNVLDSPSIWVYADITERKLAEIALQKSEERFSTAFESCPLAASISRFADGCFLEVNSSYEHQFGWTRADLIGKTSLEVGFWADQSARAAWVEATLAAGHLLGYDTLWKHKNGELRHVSLSSELTELEGQRCILTYITDITERKRAEADLRIAAAAFDAQEGMVITDANSVILRVNQAFTQLTGFTADEVIGRKPNIFKSDRHDDAFYRSMWETLTRTGRWQGEIWDRRKNGEHYPKWLTISAVKDERGAITHYIGTQFDITERKRAEEKIQSLAFNDQLTGLPNRYSLNEQLDRMVRVGVRNHQPFALMLLDLDNFKSINDSLGHHAGDQLLIAIAQRLLAAVRQSDLVARLGGDEFVIVLPDIAAPTTAAHVADKILMAVAEPVLIAGHELKTSPSIGICHYPADATDSLDLLQKADAAMYHAKSQGRNQYQFFKEEFQVAAVKRLALEADLRKAIREQQFLLHYQPQLDLLSGRVVGVEALIRWRHPERGLVSPLDFIPLAEETGMILPIGEWVIEEACRQMILWQQSGLPDLGMSVNLTASQFLDRDLPARIHDLLRRFDIPPSRMTLEVTETMSMASPEQTIASMRELTSHGFSLSIDDFGTGYSSLAYLKNFPLSSLKIDRSFVKDIETDQNDADICDVTVLLAHKLGLTVVAEGVETAAQLKYLQSIGCEKVQGHLISRPLPGDALAALIHAHPIMTGIGSIEMWNEAA